MTEEKAITRELEKIREDYEGGWKEGKAPKVEVAKEAAPVAEAKVEAAAVPHPDDAALDEALLKEKAATGKTSPAAVEEKAVEAKREEVVAADEKVTGVDAVPPRAQ